MASFAAAFCSLHTHARQGSNSEPWLLRAPNLGQLELCTGGLFWDLVPSPPPFSPSRCSVFSNDLIGQTYIKATNPLQDKMASPSSTSFISFKRPFDPISNISPWQSCAPVTSQLRQNHNLNHNPNRSRSWSAGLANALSWRHRSTPTVPSW